VLSEVQTTIDRILKFPQTWPVLDAEVRRCLVHRVPYGVQYSVEPDGVFILAVMHLRRDPDYRKHRQSPSLPGTVAGVPTAGASSPDDGRILNEAPHSTEARMLAECQSKENWEATSRMTV
jgi:hypothetical protein